MEVLIVRQDKVDDYLDAQAAKGLTRESVEDNFKRYAILAKGPLGAVTLPSGERIGAAFEPVEAPPFLGLKSRRLPANADHASGLTAAVDAVKELGLSGRAMAVWLYLLRHAGQDPRRRLELAYSIIGRDTGMSRGQAGRAVQELLAAEVVCPVRKGRPSRRGEPALAPIYAIPFPTAARLDGWIRAAKARGTVSPVSRSAHARVIQSAND